MKDETIETMVKSVILFTSMAVLISFAAIEDNNTRDPDMKKQCDDKKGVMATTDRGLACVDVIFYKVKL